MGYQDWLRRRRAAKEAALKDEALEKKAPNKSSSVPEYDHKWEWVDQQESLYDSLPAYASPKDSKYHYDMAYEEEWKQARKKQEQAWVEKLEEQQRMWRKNPEQQEKAWKEALEKQQRVWKKEREQLEAVGRDARDGGERRREKACPRKVPNKNGITSTAFRDAFVALRNMFLEQSSGQTPKRGQCRSAKCRATYEASLRKAREQWRLENAWYPDTDERIWRLLIAESRMGLVEGRVNLLDVEVKALLQTHRGHCSAKCPESHEASLMRKWEPLRIEAQRLLTDAQLRVKEVESEARKALQREKDLEKNLAQIKVRYCGKYCSEKCRARYEALVRKEWEKQWPRTDFRVCQQASNAGPQDSREGLKEAVTKK